MKERKAFNFLRSYYEVFMALTDDKDKLQFVQAILKKQFEGEEPEDLTPMAKVCYIGQKHSLDASLNGYLTKVKGIKDRKKDTPSQDPCQAPSQDPIEAPKVTPCQQEEEKEKEKEKEEEKLKKDKLDFKMLLDFINLKTGRGFKVINKSVRQKYNARLKDGFTKEDIRNSIINACNDKFERSLNYQNLTPEYFSRERVLNRFSNVLNINVNQKVSNQEWKSNPYNN